MSLNPKFQIEIKTHILVFDFQPWLQCGLFYCLIFYVYITFPILKIKNVNWINIKTVTAFSGLLIVFSQTKKFNKSLGICGTKIKNKNEIRFEFHVWTISVVIFLKTYKVRIYLYDTFKYACNLSEGHAATHSRYVTFDSPTRHRGKT